MENSNDIINAKKALRAELKQRRRRLSETQRLAFSASIAERLYSLPEFQAAQTVFSYISYATEVHTHEIIKRLLNEKTDLIVPKIIDSSYMQAQRFRNWESCEADSMGILTPAEDEVFNGYVDLVITPGLGFTPQGQRIGFGAGYYDKWFQNNTIGASVALCFETQLVTSMPVEKTDIPVDILITEERIIRI